MAPDLKVELGGLRLSTPLVAASGTVGSVWEWGTVADLEYYGAAVAKSVSPEPWEGRRPPRVAPTRVGMLNGIGIQNPGIEAWIKETAPRLAGLSTIVWGSAVAEDPQGFAEVANGFANAGIPAVEVNLSCPNLEDGELFSFSAGRSAEVIRAVSEAVGLPVGAKLSPNTPDIVEVAKACLDSGASFLVLTNTALGFGVDLTSRKPLLSGGVGGYSGPGVKPLSLRCVYEVHTALPDAQIVGCGGVMTGRDILEYAITGAKAVAVGTLHFEEPNAGKRLIRELETEMEKRGIRNLADVRGTVGEW